ncbi:MAG: hypothetical protein C6P37_16515 [Caldibacillus debilis]|uniref:Uncharacterized protein n=1 Tax=Caldibacillus debilis TaxID=301148 RepID=A0A3E0JUU8_9BACI|nr:MAG: hypothetical protein C6P37_16515 [Caldibacillus debilis]
MEVRAQNAALLSIAAAEPKQQKPHGKRRLLGEGKMNSRKGQFRWRRPFSAGTKGKMGGRDPARTAKLSLKAGIAAFEIAFFYRMASKFQPLLENSLPAFGRRVF